MIDSNMTQEQGAEAEAKRGRYYSPDRRDTARACAGVLVTKMDPSRRKELHHARTRNRKARKRVYLAPFSYWARP